MKFSTFCLLLFFFALLHNVQAQNSPAPIKLVQILLTPNTQDWNYAVNQNASVQVQVLKYGVPVNGVTINYEIGPEMLPPEKKGSLQLQNGTGKIEVGSSKVPGFRQLVVRTTIDGRAYSDAIKLAFSPQQIVPTVPLPDDFNTFWNKAKADASTIPMDAQLTPLPQYSTTTVDVYLVNLQNYKRSQRLYGYLCKPKAAGKYPVLFTPPGAGVKAMLPYTYYAEQGYISLSIEIHGISPLLDADTYKNISNAFGDYPNMRLDDRDNYYYKAVYLGCVRSIDYLCSLPEWDGKNVVVTGGSQGGALTIVTAALDKRVTCLAAFYPALCDLTGYLHRRAGGWPHLLNASNQPVNNTPAKLRTISYYDVVNFAKQITAPGFYSWGYNDNTCPPTSVFAAVNSIKAPKTIAITPISGHWRFEETNQQSLDWIKTQLIK
jgi:cephalosporin-C deacetylase